MPLPAVQSFVRSQLDQLSTPFYEPLMAHVSPPVNGDESTPQAYVWGARFTDERLTLTEALALGLSPEGYIKRLYQLNIWVHVVDSPDRKDADAAFPQLIDGVISKLRGAILPNPLVDPSTNAQSQLLVLADNVNTDYDSVRATLDERYVRMIALIVPQITEVFVG